MSVEEFEENTKATPARRANVSAFGAPIKTSPDEDAHSDAPARSTGGEGVRMGGMGGLQNGRRK